MKRLSGFTVSFFILLCAVSLAKAQQPMGNLSPTAAKNIIEARSRNALQAIRAPYMARLSRYVHPTRGLRFSPYVSTDNADRVFSRSRVRLLGNSTRVYRWGEFDGSGDPIRWSWRDYYRDFVYDRDFANAPKVNYNTAYSRGNATNLLNARFPGAIFVEYHFPGTDVMNFMNWRSLWLVWQKRGATWYLSGIAHDEWTI